MAEVLQFHCPACGGLLQIPASGAGMHGPCPQCHHPIVAPDPLRGIPAFMLAVAPPPAAAPEPQAAPPPPAPVIEEYIPVATIPPAYAEPPIAHAEPVAAPAPVVETPRLAIPEPPPAPAPAAPVVLEPLPSPPAPSPSRLGLAAALLIGGLVAVLSFAGGYQSGHQPVSIEPKSSTPTSSNPQPQPVEPSVPKAKIVEESSTEPPLPTAPALAAPRAALESFLTAPDWSKRAEFVLYPERVGPRMQAYYAGHADKPTPWSKLEVEHCEVVDSTGFLLSVFRVHTAAFPKGYPVAVAETAKGWRVDWDSFIEYQDGLFQQFVEATGEGKGTFHLIVRQSPEAAKTAGRIDYEVIPFTAPKGAVQKAGVAKDSPAAAQLAEVTPDGNVATLVLEISRHVNPDGTKRLEILSVPATNWRPREE